MSPRLHAHPVAAAAAIILSTGQASPALGADTDPAVLVREFIYESAPFPECHASTIEQTADGTIIAAWFGGTEERNKDVEIWLSRLGADGKWSTPRSVADGVQSDGERFPCWNPVLFQPSEGPLLLFLKVGASPSEWWGEVMESDDGGATWTDRRKLPALPDAGIGPVKNKPIQLADGTILCGSSSEHDGWRVHFERTADLGKTWTTTGPIHDGREIGAIQPSILRHADGRLQALGRSRQGRIWETWSEDGGLTWSPMKLGSLPNPNAGTDAVTLADGSQLLVYNHTPRGRSPLNVAVSKDGIEWQAALVLEDEPGEYSYPAVIQAKDGTVHITYTWKRERICHVAVDPAKLTLRPIRVGKWPE